MDQPTKVAPPVLLESFSLVTVAHQLYAFLSVRGPFKIVLKQSIQAAVEKILLAFSFSTRASAFSTLESAVASNTKSTPLKKQPFSQEWAVDIPLVRKAIKAFENAIKNVEIPAASGLTTRTPRLPKKTPGHFLLFSNLSNFFCSQPKNDLTSPAFTFTVPFTLFPFTLLPFSTNPSTRSTTFEKAAEIFFAPAAGLSNKQLLVLVATAVATAMAQF